MTDRPIIFSALMIRALLEGRKSQTRRTNWPLRYAVGDRLWVRESLKRVDHAWVYAADLAPVPWPPRAEIAGLERETISSLMMRRSVSRLTLTVSAVRVQHLWDITEEDAIAEGAMPVLAPPDGGSAPHVEGFRTLWNVLHGPDAWEENPWVCAISFTTTHGNIDQIARAA